MNFKQSYNFILTLCLLSSVLMAQEDKFPEKIETDQFYDALGKMGHTFVGGQPTIKGLKMMKDKGVKTVVSVRTKKEMDNRELVSFDEKKEVEKLGMHYVHIPLDGKDEPYTPQALAKFSETMDSSNGKVLLHCTVGWRASHMWVAYLVKHRGLDLNTAVEHGQAINLRILPFEGLLGQEVQYRYKVKK